MKKVHQAYVNNYSTLNVWISRALLYRTESYICAPTIYHAVYNIQAKPTNKESKLLNQCIQPYGYILSIYEQLGYLNRFYRKPSNKTCNHKKSNLKTRKYLSRIKHGADMLKTYD